MILDGKKTAQEIRGELREQIQAIRAEGKRAPKLAIVMVGHNPASETYVANKIKACAEVGIEAEKIAYDEYITEQTLLTEIQKLNNDSSIDGFIVQLPLPEHIRESVILSAIDYRKDVDGLTPMNVGRAVQGLPAIISSTPRACSIQHSDGRQTCGGDRQVQYRRQAGSIVVDAAPVSEPSGDECFFAGRRNGHCLPFQDT